MLLLGAGCAPVAPAPGGVNFGLMGDTPYSPSQAARLDHLIDDLDKEPLAFVAHVGDIGQSRPDEACGDAWLLERREQFRRIRHPFVLVPGDNEWSDCRDPQARLKKWRELFCGLASMPASMRLERQPGEFCEHVRWRVGDTLFVAINVPGGRYAGTHLGHEARERAVFAWLEEAERMAPPRLAVVMQADPFVPGGAFDRLKEKLARMAEARPGAVVLIHGDTHLYRDDMPLPGLRRVEVWGAPFVSWLRGTLRDGDFEVEQTRQY